MGRRIATAIAIAVALIAVRDAGAGFQSGSDLLQHCGDVSDSGYGLCLGYVEGVVDGMEADRATHHLPPCIREGVGAAQVHNVVIQYLRDHPEARDQTASLLVVIAVTGAWRCSQSNP